MLYKILKIKKNGLSYWDAMEMKSTTMDIKNEDDRHLAFTVHHLLIIRLRDFLIKIVIANLIQLLHFIIFPYEYRCCKTIKTGIW